MNNLPSSSLYAQFYNGYTDWLLSTGYYYNQLVDSVQPTIQFMYDNVLTNPIFMWLILVTLILSLFTFWD